MTYDYDEIDYLCRQYLGARRGSDRDLYIRLLGEEFSKGATPDPGWLDGDRPMPGAKHAVKFVGPLDLLGVPIETDTSVPKGKIVFRDRDPGDETDLKGNDEFGL